MNALSPVLCLLVLSAALAGCCAQPHPSSDPNPEPASQDHDPEPHPTEAAAPPPPAARVPPKIPPMPAAPGGLNFVEAYTARLSERDHTNMKGARLSTVAMILQEDRGNVHNKKNIDPEDTRDGFFTTFEVRKDFQDYINNGRVPPDVSQAILTGTPLVRVSIFESRDHSTNGVVVQLMER